MKLVLPKLDVRVASTDLAFAHPELRDRWLVLDQILLHKYGWRMRVIEVFRPDRRQAWLYGAGRTTHELQKVGLPIGLARPTEKRVTNAYSSRLSAHGHCRADGTPAAVGLDVCPLGPDGKPFTADDPWTAFTAAADHEAPLSGLRHFTRNGRVTDMPHLQMMEWSDATHTLELLRLDVPPTTSAEAA